MLRTRVAHVVITSSLVVSAACKVHDRLELCASRFSRTLSSRFYGSVEVWPATERRVAHVVITSCLVTSAACDTYDWLSCVRAGFYGSVWPAT